MDLQDESRRPHRLIDAAAKATFLTALRKGAPREDAAAEAGFSLTGFYGARRRDPAFRAEWAQALALPPAADRRAKAYEARGEVRIAPANRRFAQRRRRHVRFTAERRALYLSHLSGSADGKAAAAAAGICPAIVSRHRRMDPDFDELCRETLVQAYARLEALALNLAFIAQARLRHAMRAAAEACRAGAEAHRVAACPTCGHRPDEQEVFDRAMRLLALRDRKQRRAERNFRPGRRRQEATFERAIADLERYLTAMGCRLWGRRRGRRGRRAAKNEHEE